MKDTITAGSVAGMIATVALNLVEQALVKVAGIPEEMTPYVSTLILPDPLAVPAYVRFLSVALAVLGASALFGSALAYLYARTGSDFWFLKAIGFGGVLFIVHVSVIPKLWEPRLLAILAQPGVIPWQLLYKVAWAILTGYLFIRLWRGTNAPTVDGFR